jgi:putative polyketide hydroxylase
MTTTPVLIVGAGPAGLSAAITLARFGIPTLLVERRTGPSPIPRATAISTRSMELFRSWGLEERIRADEMDVTGMGWVCRTLTEPDGMAVPLGFPSREEARAASPTYPAPVPQDLLEPVLLDHLRGYPHAEVRFGAEVVAVEPHGDGVTAVVREHGTHRHTTLRCGYVIAADGVHSTVRRNLGIAMVGPDNLGDLLSVLIRAPLAEVVGDRRYGLYMIQQKTDLEVFLPVGTGRWLYSRTWSPDTERWSDYTPARLLGHIRAASGVRDLAVEVLQVGRFRFAAQVAERFRDGRVFLIGDAAHRMTPRGGTGMNTAIHDGYDLGWKLGWVLRGWAPVDLLDCYETERRPIAVRNTENSAHPNRPDPDAFANDLAGRLPHVWQPHLGADVSTLDLIGPGRTLLVGPDNDQPDAALAALANPHDAHLRVGAPVEVHRVDAAAASAFGIGPAGAVLVRPDGQVTSRWPAQPARAGHSGRSPLFAVAE